MPQSPPFHTKILSNQAGEATTSWTDMLPVYYPGPGGPELINNNVEEFLAKELSLGKLEALLKHLWFAGARRSPMPLHQQLMAERTMIITERMDLHLLWTKDRKLFIKPLPLFLLHLSFWKTFLCCQSGCECSPDRRAAGCSDERPARCQLSRQSDQKCGSDFPRKTTPAPTECSRRRLWMQAMGFLYSWACLIPYRSDFKIALDHNLLPSELSWQDWKKLASEVFSNNIHEAVPPRFLRAELRLARLDTLHRLTQVPRFEPYLRHNWDYSILFRQNIALLATITIFVALILTAMQVGLATDQLSQSKSFMAASYGFTVFAILGPFFALGLVSLQAAWNFGEYLVGKLPKRRKSSDTSGKSESSQV